MFADTLIAPLLADADFPWVVVVMMFIAFFQWLMGKLKGVVEDPPVVSEEFELAGEPQPARPAPQSPPPIPSRPAIPANSAEELRKFLQTVQENQAAAAPVKPTQPPQPKIAPPKAPPALPSSRHKLVPTEIKTRPVAPGPLRLSPRMIRDAIVLKEILDPPKSMRDDW